MNIKQQVRLVDIVPTVLDLLQIKDKDGNFDGVSLFPIIKNGEEKNLLAYSETFYPEEQTQATGKKFSHAKNKKSFRMKNKYKIIINVNNDGLEFYDLEKDPNELNNLIK